MSGNETAMLLTVGPFDNASSHRIGAAAEAASLSFVAVRRCEEATAALGGAALPVAIVMKMDAPGAELAFAQIRSQARLSRVPVFGVAPESSDVAFTELFTWGGDDLVNVASTYPLVKRLRGIHSASTTQGKRVAGAPDAPLPVAIVAGPVATWRSVIGRALHSGGFAVRFATATLAEEWMADGVRVVVAASDLPDGGAVAALEKSRSRGSVVPWVLVTPPKGIAESIAATESLGGAATMDAFAPPENVLFVINELLAARGVDKRASPRLLYGTSVAFRAAGGPEDEIGFSYNVSAGGAYVRTLAPPDPGQEVWVEMWPPRSERRVRLAGKVAWRRPYGPVGTATVPPGFGIQLTDGLAGDLGRWGAGCGAFAESMLRLRASKPVTSDA